MYPDFLSLKDDPRFQRRIGQLILASPHSERMLKDGPTTQEWLEILGELCCPIPFD
jgi:hypothetical protein